MTRPFLKYLFISLIAHILIGFSFWFIAMLSGLAGLGNANRHLINQLSLTLLLPLIAEITFLFFITKVKDLSQKAKFVVITFPFVLGICIVLFTNPVGTRLLLLSSSSQISKSATKVTFGDTYKLEPINSSDFASHAIKVPFELSQSIGINTFIFSYKFKISDSGCPDNDLFNVVIDSEGKMTEVSSYYGEGNKLSSGKYTAIKYLYGKSPVTNTKLCAEKFAADLIQNKQVPLYYSNPYNISDSKLIKIMLSAK